MRKVIVIFIVFVIGFLFGTGYHEVNAFKTVVYNGFTIAFNAEKLEGLVYRNNATNSALLVFYPSSNNAYMYSEDGQRVLNANKLAQYMAKNVSSEAIVAEIRPFKKRRR